MIPVDPRAMFVVDKAAALIAAGGVYQGKTLKEAVDEVMAEMMSLDGFFASEDDDGDEDEGNAPTSGSIN